MIKNKTLSGVQIDEKFNTIPQLVEDKNGDIFLNIIDIEGNYIPNVVLGKDKNLIPNVIINKDGNLMLDNDGYIIHNTIFLNRKTQQTMRKKRFYLIFCMQCNYFLM